jgi:hypothetical protein
MFCLARYSLQSHRANQPWAEPHELRAKMHLFYHVYKILVWPSAGRLATVPGAVDIPLDNFFFFNFLNASFYISTHCFESRKSQGMFI